MNASQTGKLQCSPWVEDAMRKKRKAQGLIPAPRPSKRSKPEPPRLINMLRSHEPVGGISRVEQKIAEKKGSATIPRVEPRNKAAFDAALFSVRKVLSNDLGGKVSMSELSKVSCMGKVDPSIRFLLKPGDYVDVLKKQFGSKYEVSKLEKIKIILEKVVELRKQDSSKKDNPNQEPVAVQPMTSDEQSALQYRNDADAALRSKTWSLAIDLYEKSIKLNPKDPRPYAHKSTALAKVKRYEEALNEVNRAISIDENWLDLYLQKARLERVLSRYAEATETLQKALSVDKGQPSKIMKEMLKLNRAILNTSKIRNERLDQREKAITEREERLQRRSERSSSSDSSSSDSSSSSDESSDSSSESDPSEDLSSKNNKMEEEVPAASPESKVVKEADPLPKKIDDKSMEIVSLQDASKELNASTDSIGLNGAIPRLPGPSPQEIEEARSLNVKATYKTEYGGYATLHHDGTVVCSGDPGHGGNAGEKQRLLTNVKSIIGSAQSFAALKEDGTVVVWGQKVFGGDASKKQHLLVNVKSITANKTSFAALKEDGSVVAWGHDSLGGDTGDVQGLLINVKEIISTGTAFAALKENGTVVTWGRESCGGSAGEKQALLVNVNKIFSTDYAFAALKEDRTVVVWGRDDYGGSAGEMQERLTDIKSITGSLHAFAAVKMDGSAVVWGDIQESSWADKQNLLSSGVKSIVSNGCAFAALKESGSVITWGKPEWGGDAGVKQALLIKIKSVVSSQKAFCALKEDGSIVVWGTITGEKQPELRDAIYLASADQAFAARRENEEDVVWGEKVDYKLALQNLNEVVEYEREQKEREDVEKKKEVLDSNKKRKLDNDSLPPKKRPKQDTITRDFPERPFGFKCDPAQKDGTGAVVADCLPQHDIVKGAEIEQVNGVFVSKSSFEFIRDLINRAELPCNIMFRFPNIVPRKEIEQFILPDEHDLEKVKATYKNLMKGVATLYLDGQVRCSGIKRYGGDPGKKQELLTNVKSIIKNDYAFAALKEDGSVVVWGDDNCGGNPNEKQDLLTNVKSITSTRTAFAALKADGSVVTWGLKKYGGDAGTKEKLLTNVKSIARTNAAFAALKESGSVIVWGHDKNGGNAGEQQMKLTDVTHLASAASAFAARRKNGENIVWGYESEHSEALKNLEKIAGQGSKVREIKRTYANEFGGFAKLYTDGTVECSGEEFFGGDAGDKQKLLVNVKSITSSDSVFAALKEDGSVVVWGDDDAGEKQKLLVNVKSICSTGGAFAALKHNGSVVLWGDPNEGGNAGAKQRQLVNVKSIVSTDSAFAALKKDGTVVVWGSKRNGGDPKNKQDLLINVRSLAANQCAFIAFKEDASLVVWGDRSFGGNPGAKQKLLTNVKSIVNTDFAFAVLKTDRTVVFWGHKMNGEDAIEAQRKLTDVIYLAKYRNAFAARRGNGENIAWGKEDDRDAAVENLNKIAKAEDKKRSRLRRVRPNGSREKFRQKENEKRAKELNAMWERGRKPTQHQMRNKWRMGKERCKTIFELAEANVMAPGYAGSPLPSPVRESDGSIEKEKERSISPAVTRRRARAKANKETAAKNRPVQTEKLTKKQMEAKMMKSASFGDAQRMFQQIDSAYGADLSTFGNLMIKAMRSEVSDTLKSDVVLSLHKKMNERGIAQTVTSFNIVIKACIAIKNFEKAMAIKSEMEQKRMMPDLRTYNMIMEICALKGLCNQAMKLKREMEKRGMKPTQTIFAFLIHSCVKDVQYKKAIKLKKEMQAMKIPLSDTIYNSLINMCTISSPLNLEIAIKLKEEMEGKGLEPDASTYAALINACAPMKLKEALQLKHEMCARKIVPHSKTYAKLLQICKKVGDGKTAAKIRAEAAERGVQPLIFDAPPLPKLLYKEQPIQNSTSEERYVLQVDKQFIQLHSSFKSSLTKAKYSFRTKQKIGNERRPFTVYVEDLIAFDETTEKYCKIHKVNKDLLPNQRTSKNIKIKDVLDKKVNGDNEVLYFVHFKRKVPGWISISNLSLRDQAMIKGILRWGNRLKSQKQKNKDSKAVISSAIPKLEKID